MTIKVQKISEIGSKAIRSRSKEVSDVRTIKVRKIIENLINTMRHENLVGIAAPQIGEDLRIFVSEIRETTYRKNISHEDILRVFINPQIRSASKGQIDGYEGCGSVATAQLFGVVKRHKTVTVEAIDENNKKFELKASGLLARIIQHEIDHLNGIVFIDKITDTKKLLGRNEYIKRSKKK